MLKFRYFLLFAVFLVTFTFAPQSVFSSPSALLPELTTEKVTKIQADANWLLVDCRLSDSFNGWQLEGVQQGGHIPGAVDFSANWLKVEKEGLSDELVEILKEKKISPEKNIVVYDANGQDAGDVAAFLKKHGFNKLHYYNIHNWPADVPLRKFANYHLIVPAAKLHDILAGKQVETFPAGKKVKIVEASWGEEKASYAKGHIPTSIHINTDNIEPPTGTDPTMWNLGDDKTLQEFALKFGFTNDDTVVVTGMNQMAAYRIALVLRYIGVKDVRVLNGGDSAWTMAGFTLDTTSYQPDPVSSFGAPVPGAPDIIDTLEEAKKSLGKPAEYTLVDNRTWDEHIGKISGYSYHSIKGRIPGSVYGYAGKGDANSLDYFRNPDKTMRNPDEIIGLWEGQGIDVNTRLAFMCGSGWRAAEVFYYADVYGLKDITVYSDGWIRWSNEGNPIETGEPK